MNTMTTVKDTVKLYIYRDRHDGRVQYFTLRMEHCDWLVLVGETTTTVEHKESDLLDPRAAQLAAAEAELKQMRADFAVTEQRLLDQIQSLKALAHEPLD